MGARLGFRLIGVGGEILGLDWNTESVAIVLFNLDNNADSHCLAGKAHSYNLVQHRTREID